MQRVRQDAFDPAPEAAVVAQYSIVISLFCSTGRMFRIGMLHFVTDNLII